MDVLSTLFGSRVRADLIAMFFGPLPQRSGLRGLGRAIKTPHQVVQRQLGPLMRAGLVREVEINGRRAYEPDATAPGAREVAALVRQTRGRIPRIRHALVLLRSPALAWALPTDGRERSRPYALAVLTSAPRSLVRVQLANLVPKDCPIEILSTREWVSRLEKGDVELRRLRRARKLWILGSWEQLLSAERAVLESKRLIEKARSNWQEELSDDWDDTWDPFQPFTPRDR